MARAVHTDPFRCFRFAPKVGFDGRPMGVARVEVRPGTPWSGPGEVSVQAMLKPDIVEFAKLTQPDFLVIGVYHITDDINGEPSLNLVLGNVTPADCSMTISPLDAAVDDILMVELKMSYNRLSFVFDGNVLDKMVAII